MIKKLFRKIGLLLILLAIPLSFGCGSDQYTTYPVAGQLQFEDGTTPMFGTIELYNEERQINARGKINRDGTFTLGTYKSDDGAVEGKHKIIIAQHVQNHLAGQIKVEIVHDHGELVHPSYYDYRTTDLSCEISAEGENQLNLQVKKHPKQN